MPRAEDKNVIQTVAPKRSDQAFSIWILPRRSRRRWSVTDAHRPNPAPEGLPVSTIIVAHQIGRRRVPRKCLHDLLRQPLRRRMPGHRKPQQLPPSVAHNKKCKQALEGQGRNHAEINRSNRLRMVAQECPPALGWRSSASDHVLGHRRLGDLEPKLQQFTMDARGAPQRVFPVHSSDEIA